MSSAGPQQDGASGDIEADSNESGLQSKQSTAAIAESFQIQAVQASM